MSLVRLRRLKLGMSQTELAKRAHMTASKLSKIENGHLKLKEDDILAFARVLGCKTSDLLRDVEEEPEGDLAPTAP